MDKFEQVEKLRERAKVSYDEAKEALNATDGDLLEALIYLEKQGKVNPPEGGGYYNSQRNSSTNEQAKQDDTGKNTGESFGDLLKKFGRFCAKIIHKGNTNTFEVLKGEESKALFPVTVLVLLMIFAFWITVPLIIIGLFFGLRYRFNGPDLGSDSINDAMNNAAGAAEDLKKKINKEIQ